ncbi:MAG TPA: glycosyltransferase [Gemmatimonadales bacterium]|nr:glycosyltransferase [Gemmatimonadales bacterium]
MTPSPPAGRSDGRIKVFHLCDKFGIRESRTHGVSRLFTWWFPRFDRSRYDVRLIGIRPEDSASAYLRSRGLDPVCLGRGPFHPAVLTDLLQLVRRERPHILQAHGYATANFARVVGALTGVRVLVHEHTSFPSVPFYQRAIDRVLAGRNDLGVAVSESTKRFMVRYRSFRPENVRVVYNGAPLEEFTAPAPARVEAERARLGLRPGEPVVGAVGRMDEQKGMTYLLQAAVRVLARRPDVRFVLAGDGHLLQRHQEEARALGIAGRTVFAGFTEDVAALQSLLDVQAFPSIFEGTPLTVFEAMAMGRAIASTTVDGLAEVLRDRQNALLVPPRDPDALAGAILALLDDPALARRLAAQAALDGRRYDVRYTVSELEKLYDELAGDRR